MKQLTPKEEAIQLVEQFYFDYDRAKECAIICVNRIMELDCVMITNFPFDNSIEYWQQVKQEILLIN